MFCKFYTKNTGNFDLNCNFFSTSCEFEINQLTTTTTKGIAEIPYEITW